MRRFPGVDSYRAVELNCSKAAIIFLLPLKIRFHLYIDRFIVSSTFIVVLLLSYDA
jgi:hypothetical protein